MILFSTLYLINTSLIQILAISSTKISSVQAIKYPHFISLSTITKIVLYIRPVIGSFNFGSFIIKSYNIVSYSLSSVTDALSTMLRLLGEELEAASWLIKARSRMEPIELCDEEWQPRLYNELCELYKLYKVYYIPYIPYIPYITKGFLRRIDI